MQRDKIWVLVIFFGVVAAAAGLQLLRGGGSSGDSRGASTTTEAGGRWTPLHSGPVGEPLTRRASTAAVRQFFGLALQLHNSDPEHPYEKYLDEIAATGANTVILVVTAYQENASSTMMIPAAGKTPTNRHIERLIRYARGKGLQVVFMPILLLENPRTGEWRGKIEPEDWDAWWQRYTDYVLQYARVAEAGGADAFIVGSELLSTERQIQRWRELIRLVRANFAGLLTYSANWDHYWVPEFWDDLDMIGMTSYHDLEVGDNPPLEELLAAWRPIRQKVLDWQKTVGLPMLFTEVGFPNQETAARKPWNYYGAPDKPAPELQALCFEAFFKTWTDEPAVAGIVVWEWRNYPGMVGGPDDTSYIPCGKPAEDVISRYFRQAEAKRAAISTSAAGAISPQAGTTSSPTGAQNP